MSDYYCIRDGKKLEYDGESWICRHCGFHDCSPPAGRQITLGEARDLVREVRSRPPFSPKCRGRLHRLCRMSGCGCPCGHKGWAAALRREALEVELRAEQADDSVLYETARLRAEELRRRADELNRDPLADEAEHRCAYHECGEIVGAGKVYCEGHR